MKKSWLWLAIGWVSVAAGVERMLAAAPERHRSPLDVAILAGGQRALTANHTADSVSLVDLAGGKVLQELPCGQRPAGVACAPDGRRAAVSNFWDGTLTLLEVEGNALRSVGSVSVGAGPRGLAFAADGDSVFVALAGDHEVLRIAWPTGKVLSRWAAPTEPRRLALTGDGRFLAAASGRSAQVRCWNTQTGKQLWEKSITDAFTLHGLTFSPEGKELVVTHSHDRHHPIAKNNIEQGWALDNRLSRLRHEPDARTPYWQIALDTRGQAVGDPCAAAFNARGDCLAVAAGGTHELLLFRAASIPWCSGDPGDFLDASLDVDPGKFRRVSLGGRPVAVQFVDSGDQVVAANYLLDAVQIVDARKGKLVRQIPLGAPSQPSLVRQGETIFYDASRSHRQWFSCHTCHPDGHTCSRSFDTLNDESYGNPKLTPSLRAVSKTGPWTWHGWQKDLGQAVEKSLTETLFGPKPSATEVKAVVAFLQTLDHPPRLNRTSGNEAVQRGQAIFRGKGHCADCHHGQQYTSTRNYDVQIEADGSPFELWNPPSLRGVADRGPYLHDGRAESLEELLRLHHSPQKVGGQALTDQERDDLIAFLRSL
jgi:cytochrome c peroxidase/sugar lactone lactonase YvrE